ncbi:hypothetical protein DRQ09_03520 [candidate division KSB1 bacterium]|nr:MAG: hypothetical protein DRQ09_03520 [candidate division KSB1 bacterium]
MTYHCIVTAPEFDSGAEKSNLEIFLELLIFHSAPTELSVFEKNSKHLINKISVISCSSIKPKIRETG